MQNLNTLLQLNPLMTTDDIVIEDFHQFSTLSLFAPLISQLIYFYADLMADFYVILTMTVDHIFISSSFDGIVLS